LFEEGFVLKESKADANCRLNGGRIIRSKEDRGEVSYSFKDFLKIFKQDPVGENIIEVMKKEIIA